MLVSLSSIIDMHFIDLTKSERRLAEYIKNNRQQVGYSNIAQLSTVVNVGEATIVRFCHKLGFNGFMALRRYLQQELLEKHSDDYHAIGEIMSDSSHLDIAKHLYQLNIDSMQNTIAQLTENSLINIVNALKNAKNIYFYGLGGSGLIALEGKYKLMRIGMRVDACTDEHMLLINSALVTSQDVIIAISNSGESLLMQEAVVKAQANGAYIITMTKYRNASINQYASEVLLNCGLDSGLELSSSTVRSSQSFLIDLLYNAYLFDQLENGDELNRLKATKEAFVSKSQKKFNTIKVEGKL